nr:nuclease-related domain-containing protein [Paenisporosarcina sp. TG20]
MNVLKTHDLDVLRISVLNSRIATNLKTMRSYRNVKAGFSGEGKVTKYLKEALLTPKITIYRNIILDNTQIDVIVVTPKLICILEVKNMVGEFYFDARTKQFFRIIDGNKEGMKNPELQLQRAVKTLQTKLHRKEIDMPVCGLIILASRAGIVIEYPTLFQAIPIDAMCDALEQLESSSHKLLTNKDLKKVDHIFKREVFEVHDEELLDRLGIERTEVIPGVRCIACSSVGMKRIYSTWVCGNCGCKDKEAHMATLQEYQLLFGREIKSQGVKWWLGIDDKYLVKRILIQVTEESFGNTRNRHYKLKFEPWLLDQFLASEMKKY